ncbi:MAG: HlyC/CorC family transporter [Rhodospirillales bacterium]|nr:HlyC/CorC family transporter [Rhodospirillales bacterium]
MSVLFDISIIVLLILLNGFFAMSELALVSSRRARLKQFVEQGRNGAATALRLADDPGRFLSAVQIGITLIGILAGAFSGATLAKALAGWLATFPAIAGFAETLAFLAVVVVITYFSLILGELVPKRIALADAEAVAVRVAPPMTLLSRVAAPAVWLLRISSEAVLRILGLSGDRQTTVTEEEVKAMVEEGADAGVFEASERDMIDGVLRLADRPVSAIMTPRIDVVWLDLAADLEQIRSRISGSGHSRFPVGNGDIDAIEGVVHAKDLLEGMMAGKPLDPRACVHEALFVHESTTVLKMLELFRSSRVHMALLVDEYGSFEGIITPTDILAAIAGAFPEDEAEAEPVAVQREDGSWLIDGRADISHVERIIERRGMQAEGDYHTLAGFVLWELGHVPQIGERLDWQGLRFEVIDMDGRRIDRVLVSPTPAAAAGTPPPA